VLAIVTVVVCPCRQFIKRGENIWPFWFRPSILRMSERKHKFDEAIIARERIRASSSRHAVIMTTTSAQGQLD
jgi:hypothetical protein